MTSARRIRWHGRLIPLPLDRLPELFDRLAGVRAGELRSFSCKGTFRMPTIALASRARAFATLVLALSAVTACGQKSASTYVFTPIRGEVEMGTDAFLDVRLTKAGSDEPIVDAVIFETRFDMEPDGMGAMDVPVRADGSPTPGTYRFIVKPSMAGRWALKLGAKVQGENDTVRGQVIVAAH